VVNVVAAPTAEELEVEGAGEAEEAEGEVVEEGEGEAAEGAPAEESE
jgi:large subunit ribosomal protein L25